MQFFLFLLIPAGLFYGYWYFIRKAQPVIAQTQTSAHFESVVPIIEEHEIELIYEGSPEMEQPVLLENDETVLLMEAEKIITEIENIVAAKENVVEKIKKLLSGFNLFYNTDYQEAINRFISTLLKRECMIELPDAEIAALWN